jgi:hypothetical protein
MLLGVAIGVMAISKFSVLPHVFLAVAFVLVSNHSRSLLSFHPKEWNWTKAFAICGVSFLVLWSSYFFRISSFEVFRHKIKVPAGDYLSAISFQRYHNIAGHSSLFLGQVSHEGGWKLYYPTVILLKWPTEVLLLLLTAIVLLILGRVRIPSELAIAFTFPGVFFLFAIMSRVDTGERLILPMYPFALFACGFVWEWSRSRKNLQIGLMALVALLCIDALRYAPDYLSYFTPFLVSDQKYMFLSDSNIDWGEGLIALREYEKQYPDEEIHLAYHGSVVPSQYGIRAHLMKPEDRPKGTVVISASFLSGLTLDDPTAFRWVLRYPLKKVLNHSLYVFEISPGSKADQ